MTIILSILAFNLIIIVHELGHFIAAKLCKIKVYEFSLFFGPKIFSFQIGETTYSLRLIPVLAYVKLEGEDEPSESDRSYSQKPLLSRMAVIAAGPFANLLIAAVILVVFYSIAGYDTTKLNDVVEDSPAYNVGIRPGDTLISYEGRRVYQPTDYLLFMTASKGKEADVVVSRDGKRESFTLKPFTIPKNRYLLGFRSKGMYGGESNVVGQIDKGTPAEKAGLKEEDRIIKLNGEPVKSMEDIIGYLTKNGDKELYITVLRDSEEKTFKIKPVQGVNSEAYDIGVYFQGNTKGNIFQILGHSVADTYAYARNIVYSIVFLFQGKFSFGDMSGPVGIVAAINGAVEMEPTVTDQVLALLKMMMFISIALGISNLLPIPPADGSKLVLLTVEGIRRKPLPTEKEAFIMMAGFVFMMLLFVVIFFNDIYKITSGTFGK